MAADSGISPGCFSYVAGPERLHSSFGVMKMSFPDIICEQCRKVLARADAERDTHAPSPEELLAAGAVPVPNFGWFCSQECAARYEQAKGRRMFDRNTAGEVQYYAKP